MTPAPIEKYRARLEELEALPNQMSGRAGSDELGAVVGRLLEAAGDVLRRSNAVKVPSGLVDQAFKSLPDGCLRAWVGGVDCQELGQKLKRAADHAVEAAFPESGDDAETLMTFAMQDLMARDRLESALVALEHLARAGRAEAFECLKGLRDALTPIDATARRCAGALTVLNAERRREAQLLDEACRGSAYWLSLRVGLEDDALVRVLGGEAAGTMGEGDRSAHALVMEPRSRGLTEDELFRLDVGLASPAEVLAFKARTNHEPELKLVMAAMEAGERAIEELEGGVVVPLWPQGMPEVARPPPPPELVDETPDFKVLLFRAKTTQLIVQPRRGGRFAAAAVYDPLDGQTSLISRPSEHGISFELGAPEKVRGQTALVVAKLMGGESVAVKVKL